MMFYNRPEEETYICRTCGNDFNSSEGSVLELNAEDGGFYCDPCIDEVNPPPEDET